MSKPIRSAEDYIASLRGRKLRVFLFGELVDEPVDHPLIRPSINAVAETYELALRNPELGTTVSPYTGERINRFLHVAGSAQDLVLQNKMQLFGLRIGKEAESPQIGLAEIAEPDDPGRSREVMDGPTRGRRIAPVEAGLPERQADGPPSGGRVAATHDLKGFADRKSSRRDAGQDAGVGIITDFVVTDRRAPRYPAAGEGAQAAVVGGECAPLRRIVGRGRWAPGR